MKNARTPHTYSRRTITLPPDVDMLLLELARRDHGGNVSQAVSALVTKCEGRLPGEASSSHST